MGTASDWHSAPAPTCDSEQLSALLEEFWGLTGSLTRLYAERDLNHRLKTPEGQHWLIKLSHPDATEPRLAFENRVLTQLSADTNAPRVPGVLEGHNGATLFPVAGAGYLRVLEWLDGTPLGVSNVDSENHEGREALGRCCARLNDALMGFSAASTDGEGPAAALPRDLPWDLLRLEALTPLIEVLPEASAREMVSQALAVFEQEAAPRLRTLPRQLIHNDLNPDNLLVDTTAPGALPAVIDFGDMVRAPVVCDLAIACAYHVHDSADPLLHILDIVRGFHAERSLQSEEQALLPLLITGRLCQTLLIQGARYAEGAQAQEATYRRAAKWLDRLMKSDQTTLGERLRAVCDA